MSPSRDRAIVIASLVGITGLAWVYLFILAQRMTGMSDMPGMAMSATPAPFIPTAIMWAVMMVGMMLPSAMPMILLFTMVQRRQGKQPLLAISMFVAGYVLVWTAFSIVAAALQIALGELALLSPSMTLVSIRISALAFLLAAAYELSPLKNRCLSHCISPMTFIVSHWRPGVVGALRMGLSHGTFCVGCCWALMLLLFVAGVMNLLWVAALAILVLLQKVVPYQRPTVWITAGSMAAIGVVLLVLPA